MLSKRTRGWLMVSALGLITPVAAKAQDVQAAIVEQNEKFSSAFNKGDVAAVAAMYTEDAVAFPPGGDLVKGRAAIQAMWTSVREAGLKNVALKTVSVEHNGPLAIEIGTATATMKETPQQIKYVVVWKRQSDGSWKLHRDIWNDMPAATK